MCGNDISMIEIVSACSRASLLELAFRRQHGLDLVHVHVDRAHQDLAREDRILRRRQAPGQALRRATSEPREAVATPAAPNTAKAQGEKPSSLLETRHFLGAKVCGKDLPVARRVTFFRAPPFRLGIAQRAEVDLDLLAGFHRISRPAAGAHQVAGARHLHQPRRSSPLLDGAVDERG